MPPDPAFRRCVDPAGAELPLAEAALLFARTEYPRLDVNAYLRRLDGIAAAVRERLPAAAGAVDTLRTLNRYLFKDYGLSGAGEDYYDPCNSFLNDVLDRRLGIPISLSVVYLEVAWRLGLPLEGVSFPGHFLVKLALGDGLIVLDPFFGGISLDEDDLRQRLGLLLAADAADVADSADLPELLHSADNRDILCRMLRNLKAIYHHQGDLERTLTVCNHILAAQPDSAVDLRDRGLTLEQLQCPLAALQDYRRYLAVAPRSKDRQNVEERIEKLALDLPALN